MLQVTCANLERLRAHCACQEDLHWTTAFTSRLSDTVKLVGSVISCGGIFKGELRRSPSRTDPHVQSYALATDQAGLKARGLTRLAVQVRRAAAAPYQKTTATGVAKIAGRLSCCLFAMAL